MLPNSRPVRFYANNHALPVPRFPPMLQLIQYMVVKVAETIFTLVG